MEVKFKYFLNEKWNENWDIEEEENLLNEPIIDSVNPKFVKTIGEYFNISPWDDDQNVLVVVAGDTSYTFFSNADGGYGLSVNDKDYYKTRQDTFPITELSKTPYNDPYILKRIGDFFDNPKVFILII